MAVVIMAEGANVTVVMVRTPVVAAPRDPLKEGLSTGYPPWMPQRKSLVRLRVNMERLLKSSVDVTRNPIYLQDQEL
jgi:hypothetical protein